tara:strand:+ start:284 stop:511 length:228 start_codon:yes stop_codon:yes gene_type:complete
MTQDNISVDVAVTAEDIRKVLSQDAKVALQVQNAALNRTVVELTARLDAANTELVSVRTELEKAQEKDNKGKKGG